VQRIEIIDTTFRDGLQSPIWYDSGVYTPTLSEKLELLEALIALGVKHLEFFSPIVGTKESEDFAEMKKFILSHDHNVMLHAHCRCNEKDIALALDAGFTALNLYMGTSAYSLSGNHKKNIQEVGTIAHDTISNLRKSYPHLWIRFSGEDAFRTDIDSLLSVYSPLAQYLDAIGTPDTVGIADPESVKTRIQALKKAFPTVDIECHFHNDKGYSLINAVTAAVSGAKYIDCSVWGLAERSGITSTTGLLLNLYESDPQMVAGYDLANCYPLNVVLATILNMQIPITEPVSLTNRTHIAGVHQNAVNNDSSVYEAHNLAKFGVSEQQLILNHLMGANTIYYHLKEIENYQITKDQAREIAQEFKSRTREINKHKNARTLLREVVQQYNLSKISLPEELEKKRLENLSG
jgi:homocitrate synthase